MTMVRWVELDAKHARDRTLGALSALVEDLAAGRTPVAAPELGEEVRRRDAELWDRIGERRAAS